VRFFLTAVSIPSGYAVLQKIGVKSEKRHPAPNHVTTPERQPLEDHFVAVR